MPGRRRSRSRLSTLVSALFIIPSGPVVGLSRCIEARIQSIFGQLETFLHNERGIRVVDEIIFRDAVILNRIADHSAEKCNVRSRADLTK